MRAVCHSIATPSIITKSEQGRVIINTSLQSAEARAFIYIGYDSRYAYTAYFPHTKAGILRPVDLDCASS